MVVIPRWSSSRSHSLRASSKSNWAVGRGRMNCSILSEWTSKKPGVMYRPWASMTRSAGGISSAMEWMRSPSMTRTLPSRMRSGWTMRPF